MVGTGPRTRTEIFNIPITLTPVMSQARLDLHREEFSLPFTDVFVNGFSIAVEVLGSPCSEVSLHHVQRISL